ncbi:MAG: hypothetical protein Q4P08_05010 [Eubacteriales bacterium]|nr:hypothetical protein [Eubacteriales bacterium]
MREKLAFLKFYLDEFKKFPRYGLVELGKFIIYGVQSLVQVYLLSQMINSHLNSDGKNS